MKKLKETNSFKIISEDVNTFVKEKLENYTGKYVGNKTIHDPIWGSTEYKGWEMQIIDSPLIQRLRNISQVGLAVLTYPAARHSRFEHTLGVVAATKRIVDRININCNDDGKAIVDSVKNKLVLAAIMHDVGHCFYSHLSESIYRDLPHFNELLNEIKELLNVKPKPHEILSLIIVNCKSFKDFFYKTVLYPDKGTEEQSEKILEDVGKIIIGAKIIHKKDGDEIIESYQTAIINGPFDVDKLDYIKRDSFTAGLSLDFDIERLFTKIKIKEVAGENKLKEHRLVIEANGVTAIEELTFCKMMLHSYIYYHQKVLITETIIKDYAYALYELGILKSFADFLKYDETVLLELSEKQNGVQPFEYGHIDLKQLVNNIRNRILPKRCFEVGQSNVQNAQKEIRIASQEEEKSKKEALEKIIKDLGEYKNYTSEELDGAIKKLIPNYTGSDDRFILKYMLTLGDEDETTFIDILKVRNNIYEELMKVYAKHNKKRPDFDVFDIYFVCPRVVYYKMSNNDMNVIGRDGKLTSISKFVPLEQWAESFNSFKWKMYVYVSDKIDHPYYALEACCTVILQNKIHPEDLEYVLKSNY